MEYRILTRDDVGQYKALRLISLQTDPESFGSDYAKEKMQPIEYFEQRIQATTDKFAIGAFQAGKLVCVCLFVREVDAKVRHKGGLRGMYCDRKYRGTGVSKQLVAIVLRKAKMLVGLEIINLFVLSRNKRAVHFYQSFGFKKYGTEKKALFDGENYFDEDLMQLDFSNKKTPAE